MSGGATWASSKSQGQLVDKQAKEFKGLRGPFADLLSGSFGDIGDLLGGDLNFAGGEIALDEYRNPMTAGEQEALSDLGIAAGGSANEQRSSDLIGQTLSGDFLSPANNPALGELLRYTNQAINEAYNDQGSQAKALFARAGQSLPESSPFAAVAGDIEKARLDAIGKNVAAMTSQNYQAERDRQVQAVEQARSTATFEFNRQLDFLKASALPRLIDEIGFDRAFTEFQSRLSALSQALGIVAGVTAPVVGTESRASAWSLAGKGGYGGSGGASQ